MKSLSSSTIDPMVSASVKDPLSRLSRLALGFSGADVEFIVRSARQTARRERRPLEWSDIERGFGALSSPMSPELRWSVCVHEAGHAIAFHLLGIAEVSSIVIGVAGRAHVTVAYLRCLENEDWLMRQIACSLAAREAEKLLVGELMLGSGGSEDSDLGKATALALSAETDFGIGSVNPLIFHQLSGRFNHLVSDRQLAGRVHARLEEAETIAHKVVNDNIGVLDRLARLLFEQRVMTGEEFAAFMSAEHSSRA